MLTDVWAGPGVLEVGLGVLAVVLLGAVEVAVELAEAELAAAVELSEVSIGDGAAEKLLAAAGALPGVVGVWPVDEVARAEAVAVEPRSVDVVALAG